MLPGLFVLEKRLGEDFYERICHGGQAAND